MTKKINKTNKPASQPKPIGGKLGVIAKAIGTPKGAALSRLRKRGIAIVLGEVDGRKAYRAKTGAHS